MDYKIALVVLVIVSCPWVFPEYGKLFVYSCLFTSTCLYCVNYLKANVASKVLNMLREIQLKATFERWMSNVIKGTEVTVQKCFLTLLVCVIPILIQVYVASLLVFYLACIALLWWIFSCMWRHIQHKYLVNIHPWVMSVVNWINGICYWSVQKILCVSFVLISMIFFGATSKGFIGWLFVIAHDINVDLSKSMGVRNSTIHLDNMIKFDNFTGSSKKLVMTACEFGILHTDLSELTKNNNMTQTERLKAGAWMSVIKFMKDAKHDIEMNQMELEGFVEFIKDWMPELEPFKRQIIYSPYFFGLYRFWDRTELFISNISIPSWILLYLWLLWIRYLEYGLFGAIFHWNTCCYGIFISILPFIWSCFTLWVTKQNADSQELEHATSQPHATQTPSARGRSPGARRAS